MSNGPAQAVPAAEEREHALLAPSSSERWLNCPASARLEDLEPDTAGESAREGTLAHTIAELKLRRQYLEPMHTRTFNSRMKKLKENPLYQEEMQGYTDEYIDYINQIAMRYPAAPFVNVELELTAKDFDPYIPEEKGYVDNVLIYGNNLHVTDFKYGRKVAVDAENNTQMMIYALGVIQHYQWCYDLQNIHMAVVQPRNGGIKEWSTTKSALMAWAESTLKPIAQIAFTGGGECKKGDWCTFCRIKGKCRLWAQSLQTVQVYNLQLPPVLSNEEIGKALEAGEPFIKWYKKLKDYATAAILRGEEIPSWKVVAGRGDRSFIDTDKAFEAVQAFGYDKDLLYARQPITLTAVEKLMGKKDFEKISPEHVHRLKGRPTLVSAADSREPYQGVNATDYFKPQPQN